MQSCLGQSTWHLSSDPSDILFVPAASYLPLCFLTHPWLFYSPFTYWRPQSIEVILISNKLLKATLLFFLLCHPGRLWRAADVSPTLWPVVYCWSDQLGTWMRANWFSGGLHSCDVHQEMDIYIPAFLKTQNYDKPHRHSGFSWYILSRKMYCTQGLKSC